MRSVCSRDWSILRMYVLRNLSISYPRCMYHIHAILKHPVPRILRLRLRLYFHLQRLYLRLLILYLEVEPEGFLHLILA